MIRYQELLLPSHKDGSAIPLADRQIRFLELILDVPEGGETRPVNHVFMFTRPPVLRQESISTADNLGVKVRRKLWPIVGQPSDAKIATEEGR
jgi:hypothetical protein